MEKRKAAATSSWMIEQISRCEWFTKRDREEVYRLLYSDDVREQTRGVERLAAWRARAHPRVPLGFEVTASLLIALMPVRANDVVSGRRSGESIVDDETIRLNLAMAIVRFVNLVTEIGQVMGYVMTVSNIATKMGVPEWIVDIRHSSTHSFLPSTKVLVASAEFALRWTRTHFWEADDPLDVQGTGEITDRSQNPLTNVRRERDVVEKCLVQAQIEWLNKDQKGVSRGQHEVTLDKLHLHWLKDNETEELVDILVEDGLLVGSRDIKAFNEFVGNEQALVEHFRVFWLSIFEDLFEHDEGLFPGIVKALVIAASRSSSLSTARRTRLALEWLLVMVDHRPEGSRVTTILRDALLTIAPGVTRNALQLLIRLKQISDELPRKKVEKEKPEVSFKPSRFYLADSSPWQFCPGQDWSKFAIGVNKDDDDDDDNMDDDDDNHHDNVWFPDKLRLNIRNDDVTAHAVTSSPSIELKRKR